MQILSLDESDVWGALQSYELLQRICIRVTPPEDMLNKIYLSLGSKTNSSCVRSSFDGRSSIAIWTAVSTTAEKEAMQRPFIIVRP